MLMANVQVRAIAQRGMRLPMVNVAMSAMDGRVDEEEE